MLAESGKYVYFGGMVVMFEDELGGHMTLYSLETGKEKEANVPLNLAS